MRHEHVVAPSILSADFARLADEVAEVADHVPWVHVDVMDGHYVPNLTIGPGVVRSLRRAVPDHVFDTHLMITDPRTYAPMFVDAGADSITFHPETDEDPAGLVDVLHARGARVGVAVKPAHPLDTVLDLLPSVDLVLLMTVEPGFGGQSFMPEVVPKIAAAAAVRDDRGLDLRIEVDGGIDPDTVGRCARAGADTFVAGSAVFGRPDRGPAVADILAAARAAGPRGTPAEGVTSA